jgi:DNA-binding MarR family transcriptional regulator
MDDRSDYSRGAGGAALGARLRRLSERLDRDSTRVYAAQGVAFEQRWFGVLNQLILNGPASVGDIAVALRITHVSVSQASRSLEKAGAIRSDPDPADARRRTLSLTDEGRALADRLQPLWIASKAAAAELNEEAANAVAALDRLDDALARKSLFDRITERIGSPPGDTD